MKKVHCGVRARFRVVPLVSGWLVGLILAVALLFAVSGCDIAATATPQANATPQAAASWADQLQVAQTAVAKIDPNANLSDVSSSPRSGVSSSWNYSDTFSVTFTYLSASGNRIGVTFNDPSPAATVRTTQIAGGPTPDAQSLTPAESQQALSRIAISPREAGLITWEDAATQAAIHGASITPLIGIDFRHSPVVWLVEYIPTSFTGGNFKGTVIYVDAHTGEIIQRGSLP